jgi:DNA-binding SARP family transcriptional activator/tetratricopeptide (TPR) repeat protein
MLGPLEISDGGEWLPVGAPKGRSVLGILLIRAPEVVSMDQLSFELWGDAPPKTAVTQLHGYVMRLRRLLGDAGQRVIVTAPPGYRLVTGEREVDVQVFTELVERGRAALDDGRAEQAAALLRDGLAVWRGPALFDVPPSPLVSAEASRLAEQRLAAQETRIEADLRCGRHVELIGELERLVEEHPLREAPWRQLMVALHRTGRRGEALAAFRRLRRTFVDELGVEPSAAVRELHRSLLADDRPVEDSRAGSRPMRRPHPVPRQLPAAPRFMGRSDEVKQLDELLDGDGGPGTAMVISAIGGTAGVGKTALAVHWAHRAASRFPDGQLFVNLRGHDAGPPVTPAVVLGQFLRALGVTTDQIPHDTEERAALYRSVLAERRMLVVLDNASDADQVRPLLPGSPACLTLVTSRDDLRALTVTHGARGLRLDVLRHDDALALLTGVLGAERARAETGNLAELARLCGHLPLALRIAAANLAVRPAQTIAGQVAELRGGDLLGKLSAGDDRQAMVRAAFDLSYATLSAPARRLFRLLGVAPGKDFTAHTAAALLDTSASDASAILDQLCAAHLIEPLALNRFTFHDLIRRYASALAGQEDPEPVRREALARLLDHYLSTASAAGDRYAPYEQIRRFRPERPLPSTVDFADRDEAMAWLDAERDNLLAVAAHAARHGWPRHATDLADALFHYFDVRGDWDNALVLQHQAVATARAHGDLPAQAAALRHLAITLRWMGRHVEALEHSLESRSIAHRLKDPTNEARFLFHVAIMYRLLGRYPDALDHLRQAGELFERTGDLAGQARVLYNLGSHLRYTGRYAEALTSLEESLVAARKAGNRTTEGNVLTGLGQVFLRLGRHREAVEHITEALGVARTISNPAIETFALNNLGLAHRAAGRYGESLRHHEQALAIALRVGDRNAEFESRCGLGEALCAAGRLDEALRHARAALALATELRVVHDEARARDSLAVIHAELGQHDRAREHWQRALAVYTELGDPRAGRVSERLRQLPAELHFR